MILNLKTHYEVDVNTDMVPYLHQCPILWIDSLMKMGHFIMTEFVYLKG